MTTTRRHFLTAVGSTATLTITAGCLGSSSSSPPSPTGSTVSSLPHPVQSSGEPSITVDVFGDFACPHCKGYHEDVEPVLLDDYVSEGVIEFRHFDYPLPVDPEQSWNAAIAARAVQDTTGQEAFWSYRDAVYTNQDSLSADLLADLASDVGATSETVANAIENATYQPVVQADKETGTDQGVEGTPTTFVDGQKTVPEEGEVYREVVVEAIENRR